MVAGILTGLGAGAGVGSFFLFIVIGGFYFLPTIVAVVRKVANLGSVVVINFFLGWTLVGWVVALAMASKSVATPVQVVTTSVSPPPVQARVMETSTRICTSCNKGIGSGVQFCPWCGASAAAPDTSVASPATSNRGTSQWCDKCQAILADDAKFCPKCGGAASPADPFKCLTCKGSITVEDNFCPSCGAEVAQRQE